MRQLEYIVAVADHGHFGRAAEAVRVSQPGLSAQIKDVEARLGLTLFERTTRTVRLTPVGEVVAAWSRSVLLSIDEMVLDARQQSGLNGPVSVGVIPTIAPYLLPKVVAQCRLRWPQIRLEISEHQSASLVHEIESGQLDLGLLATPYDTRRLSVDSLGEEHFLLAVPDGHRLSGEAVVSVDVLSTLSVLLLEEGHCLRDHARAACEIAGSAENSDVRSASLSTLCQMVAADIGVTLLPAGAVGVEARPGSGLVCVPFSAPVPGRGIGLVWRRTDPRSTYFEELGALLREARVVTGSAD